MAHEPEREHHHTADVPVRSSDLRDDDRLRDDRVIASQPTTDLRRDTRQESARDYQVELPRALNLDHDRVRWGAIWAGLLAAVGALLLLSLLGLAIGATTINPGTANGGPFGGNAGAFSAVWAGIAGIISFVIGGLVASRAAAVFDRSWGALNGAMVFLLAIPVTLILGFMGLGGLLGFVGNLAAMAPLDPAAMQGAAAQAQAQAPDAAQTATMVRDGAWGTLLGLVLGLAAATLGGALGTRRSLDLERTEARLTRD